MSAEKSTKEGIIGSGRLDTALAALLPDLSRERIKSLILEGFLIINNQKIISPSSKKYEGQAFTLHLPMPKSDSAIAQDIALNVVFEDEHLIIIDKPAGMVVHPSAGHEDGTLVNALLYHCNGTLSGIGGVERPGIVHRIDRDTSGLIVAAKTDAAHSGLSTLFASHDIDRQYLAIVSGRPRETSATIATQIGRSPHHRKKMDVLESGKGKYAATHYKVEHYLHMAALVRCTLETGRTHQIRVHMKSVGHTLFNDARYGGDKILKGTVFTSYKRFVENTFELLPRQALHAHTLGFEHPITKERMYFESKLPDDFSAALEKWRGYTTTRKELKD